MVGQLEIAGLTSFNRVGNAPRVNGEQTRMSLDTRGVAHAVKRRKGAIQSCSTTRSCKQPSALLRSGDRQQMVYEPVEKRNLDALVRVFSSWKRTDEGVHPTIFNRPLPVDTNPKCERGRRSTSPSFTLRVGLGQTRLASSSTSKQTDSAKQCLFGAIPIVVRVRTISDHRLRPAAWMPRIPPRCEGARRSVPAGRPFSIDRLTGTTRASPRVLSDVEPFLHERVRQHGPPRQGG